MRICDTVSLCRWRVSAAAADADSPAHLAGSASSHLASYQSINRASPAAAAAARLSAYRRENTEDNRATCPR